MRPNTAGFQGLPIRHATPGFWTSQLLPTPLFAAGATWPLVSALRRQPGLAMGIVIGTAMRCPLRRSCFRFTALVGRTKAALVRLCRA